MENTKIVQFKACGETINFNEVRHLFTHKDGTPIDSVTKFTGILDKSTPLMFWAVKLFKEHLFGVIKSRIITIDDIEEGAKQHRIKKEEGADIGTQCHEWVSNWILGKKQSIPDNDKVRNGIESFLKFQEEYKLKWIESEKFIYSKKYDFAGILDAIAMKGRKRILVDFKSSNGIYPEHIFQTAGYQIGYEEMTKKKVDYRLIIKFGKDDGEFEAIELHDNEADKKGFLACVDLTRSADRIKKLLK